MLRYKSFLGYSVFSSFVFYMIYKFWEEPIAVIILISLLAALATYIYIPQVEKRFKKVGLYGADMNKPHKPILAEGMGVVAALFYLIATILFIPVIFNKWELDHSKLLYRFPYNKFGEYLSALLSLQSMVFLGFADDVLNLRWRFKLILPTIASIPFPLLYGWL
ncbi:hypothetical protein BB559_007577 [Furculomyces boomerangus]|uniref:Uncharacterized protein n=2 Tax=Harpellales TaxID=61421 RepID=A0A2T9XWU0_9FUNG|nr:hypothetical protein BB559_007577 [Furculomyces boomerangus]PWA02388.1 hypothetical protein BB558_001460 [Smittium angustum]